MLEDDRGPSPFYYKYVWWRGYQKLINAWRWPWARLSKLMNEDDRGPSLSVDHMYVRWRGYQKSEISIDRCLKMTSGEAVKSQRISINAWTWPWARLSISLNEDDGGCSLSVDHVWWRGYQKSENIDRCLKMTCGEAVKNQRILTLEDDWWRGCQKSENIKAFHCVW